MRKIATQDVRDQVNNKILLIAEVDSTINSVCKMVKKNDFVPGEYAEVVKALAQLVIARTLL